MFGVLILRVPCCKWQNCEATTIEVPCLQFSRLEFTFQLPEPQEYISSIDIKR
jgi:hypothetical protein